MAAKAEPIDFQGVDGEAWVRRFLADLDRFVGATPTSAPAGLSRLSDPWRQAVDCKRAIAGAIAADLQTLFDGQGDSAVDPQDPHGAQGLASARDLLRSLLCRELLEAYDHAVVVQYDVRARLPWAGGPGFVPRALHGPARLESDGAAVPCAAARTGLVDGDRFATFVPVVQQPARRRWVDGRLHCTCTHAEFEVPSAGLPPGCEAHDGPCVVPLQGADGLPATLLPKHPGALRVPVPLRRLPLSPEILSQAARATHAQPAGLDAMPRWTYELTFRHEFAAQDTVLLRVDFQPDARLRDRPALQPDELFDALAQYMAVADPLWTLLAPLGEPGDAAATLPGVNAARSFVQLACAVARHWPHHVPGAAGNGAPWQADAASARPLSFDARASYSNDGQTLQGISLRRGPADGGGVDAWPAVAVVLDARSVPLEAQRVSRDTMLYRPAAGTSIPALERQTLRLTLDGLHVAEHQTALARIAVVRNQDLLYDPLHADALTLPTNPRLLLTSAEMVAPSAVTPLIECLMPQEISGVDVKTALSNALQALFPPASSLPQLVASWQVSWVHALARDAALHAESPLVRTPVALCPLLPLDHAAEALAAAVQAWDDTNPPASPGGGWLFGLVLWSAVQSEQRPLFRAELLYRPG